ncbi:MAG: acetoacetate decarboxylase family protein [Steroidobacteraceae bacterium]
MPRVFGALPGPRNVPSDKQQLPNNQRNLVLSVTTLTDAALLSEILPPDCELDGEPLLTINLNFMSNIGWLAGHGYAMLSVNLRIKHHSPTRGWLSGNFIPALWENLADPILTGREELGWSKLYADLPDPLMLGNRYAARALWQGFKFFDIQLTDLVETSITPPAPTGHFHYKYIPRTGALQEADVAYLEYAAPGENVAGYAPLSVTSKFSGTGRFQFHSARWEDMPFQYPIINALARLPLLEVRAASLTHMAANGVIGDPNGGALRQID